MDYGQGNRMEELAKYIKEAKQQLLSVIYTP